MAKEVVCYEVAEKEVNEWLDLKRISEKARRTNADAIEKLIDAVIYGDIIINEDKSLKHVLLFPILTESGEVFRKEFTYKFRIPYQQIQARTANLKVGDIEGRILAYASALSDEAAGVLSKMDTADFSLLQAVVTFFF